MNKTSDKIEIRYVMDSPSGTIIMDEDGEVGGTVEQFFVEASQEFRMVIVDFERNEIICFQKEDSIE